MKAAPKFNLYYPAVSISFTPNRRRESTTTKKREASTTIRITIVLVIVVSRRLGQTIFLASERTSWMN
jgi:hypothetical protein